VRWTRKGILEEIKKLHAGGQELNYAAAEASHLNLMRAAAWHFGTWRRAVELAGINYEEQSKYQRWNRERIIARIRELHKAKADLSWRAISTEIDPPLAAAALRPNGFASWRDAIAAAGLDIREVARYQHWTSESVLQEIQSLHRRKQPLSSKTIQVSHQSLFCAARRRFGSWDGALEAAGLDATLIRLRQSGRARREAEAQAVTELATLTAKRKAPATKVLATKIPASPQPANATLSVNGRKISKSPNGTTSTARASKPIPGKAAKPTKQVATHQIQDSTVKASAARRPAQASTKTATSKTTTAHTKVTAGKTTNTRTTAAASLKATQSKKTTAKASTAKTFNTKMAATTIARPKDSRVKAAQPTLFPEQAATATRTRGKVRASTAAAATTTKPRTRRA
jgi:hypothetical protein